MSEEVKAEVKSLAEKRNKLDINDMINTISKYTLKKVIIDGHTKHNDDVIGEQKALARDYNIYKQYNSRDDLVKVHNTILKYFSNVNEYSNMLVYVAGLKNISSKEVEKDLDRLMERYTSSFKSSPDVNFDRIYVNELKNHLNRYYGYEYRVPDIKEIKEAVFVKDKIVDNKKKRVRTDLFNVAIRRPETETKYYDQSDYFGIDTSTGKSGQVAPQYLRGNALQNYYKQAINIIVQEYYYDIKPIPTNTFTIKKHRDISYFKNLTRNTWNVRIISPFIVNAYKYRYTEIFNHFYALLYEIIDPAMVNLVTRQEGRMIITPMMEVRDKALEGAPPELILFNTRELNRDFMSLFLGQVVDGKDVISAVDPDLVKRKLIRTFYESKMQSYQQLSITEEFKGTPVSGSDEAAYTLINRDVDVILRYDIQIYTRARGKASKKGLCFFESLLDAEKVPSNMRQVRMAEICQQLEISLRPQTVEMFEQYTKHYNINTFILDNTCSPVVRHHFNSPHAKETYRFLFEMKGKEHHFSFVTEHKMTDYINDILRRDKAIESGKVCRVCQKVHMCLIQPPINKECKDCNMKYTTEECFNNHKEICKLRKKCKDCKSIYRTEFKHVCNQETCLNCKELIDPSEKQHKCYFQKPKNAKVVEAVIYFDFETLLDNGKHIVNFWAARVEIMEKKDKKDRITRKAEILRCQGDTIETFYEMIIKYKNSMIIAHNLRGYDGILLVEYMTMNEIKFDIIKRGCKIVTLTIPEHNITALDSYAHLSYPLSDFPKAFGLKEMKKGHFPYKFNTPSNQNYVGVIPDISYFEPERHKDEKSQKAFYKWYEENKNIKYDFMKELKEYCVNDVELLADGFKKYRQTLIELTGYDPLNKITIAGVSMDVFLSKYKEHDIALIDTNNYKHLADKANARLRLNVRKYQAELVKAKEKKNEHDIKTCEQMIKKYDKKFLSCYEVGCILCYKGDLICPRRNKLMGDIWTTIRAKSTGENDIFKNAIFEHDYVNMYNNGELLTDPIDEFIETELTPQECLFGGYTETFKFYCKTVKGETIWYIDINSSYPAQMLKLIYFGHPTIIKENFKDISAYHGVIKCKVLAPKGLPQGYLPTRINGKLKLPLCRTCAGNESINKCECKDSDRMLYGAWFTHELNYAISRGYEVKKIYEVHHFKESARSDGVFKKYIETLYRLKQEKSGSPFKDDEELLLAYCKKYGLRREQIEDNPTLKNIAKALMNNTYGKTGENPNRNTKTEILYDADDFPDVIFDYTKNINRVEINDGVMEIQTKQRGGFYFPKKTTNPYIAGLITAYGRVQLYSTTDKLRNLGCEVLYCDTDSIVFNDKGKDISAFKQEHFDDYELGKWKLEVEKTTGTTEIDEFVSLGPKTYSFRMKAQNKESLKSKGFSLNLSTAKIINFDTYKEILDDNILLKANDAKENVEEGAPKVKPTDEAEVKKTVSITSTLFKKGKCADGIKSVEMSKKLSFVYSKRRIIPGSYDTEPF